jgi:uncharacterized membrane protein YphA (DoxX/SURF4 family)
MMMTLLFRAYYGIHDFLFGLLAKFDGLAPLFIRLYLAPVMVAAGLYKFRHLDAITQWLDSGLGLPEPELLAQLLTYTELIGGFLLLFGLAVRWVSIPLMVAMFVAAVTVHWDNGWFAIAPADPTTSTAKPLADLGLPAARASLENSQAVADRLARVSSILDEHANEAWLTEKGNFAVLNNGIEFAATYFIMLLSLLFSGGGRWFSLDYYLDKQARARIRRHLEAKAAAAELPAEPESEAGVVVAPPPIMAPASKPSTESEVPAEAPAVSPSSALESEDAGHESKVEAAHSEPEAHGADEASKAESPKQ